MKVVQELIGAGSNIAVANREGQTALDVAKEYNKAGVVAVLSPAAKL
jgi:ankyrin repeat protein